MSVRFLMYCLIASGVSDATLVDSGMYLMIERKVYLYILFVDGLVSVTAIISSKAERRVCDTRLRVSVIVSMSSGHDSPSGYGTSSMDCCTSLSFFLSFVLR